MILAEEINITCFISFKIKESQVIIVFTINCFYSN
jgi:hypothetical protein